MLGAKVAILNYKVCMCLFSISEHGIWSYGPP